MCKIENRVGSFGEKIAPFAKDLYSFANKKIGFNRPPTIVFDSNEENGKKILGKTAFYEPSSYTITVYVDGRHPKDILRSIAHELVHHRLLFLPRILVWWVLLSYQTVHLQTYQNKA